MLPAMTLPLLMAFVAGFVLGLVIGLRRGAGAGDGVVHPSAPARPIPPDAAGQIEEVRRLAQNNQLIAAIKLYRSSTGAGLKEAKEAVEAMIGR